jgi:hypothetical protein
MSGVERGIYSCGDVAMWVDKPQKFRFISLALPPLLNGNTTILRDGLGCSTPAINLLRRGNFQFIKQVERSTGCEIIITPQT